MKRARIRAARAWPAIFVMAAFLMSTTAISAEPSGKESQDINELTLEELLNLTVVSSSKFEQSVFRSPNSITVITAEDIRRSGYRTIPEALKLAPGVFVAKLSENRFVVSVLGPPYNQYTRDLLVLVDGVAVFQADYGGVVWADLPVTIDEVKRIEVIRGPGGVLYGANAVNGVINIFTFDGGEGSPSYVKVRAGTQKVESANAATTLSSKDGAVRTRIATEYREDDDFGMNNGADEFGGSKVHNVSIRNTIKASDNTRISLDAKYGQSDLDYYEYVTKPRMHYYGEQTTFRGRIDQDLGDKGQWYFQAYYWRYFDAVYSATEVYQEDPVVQDLEFQYMLPFEAAGQHKLSFGGGYRWAMGHEKYWGYAEAYTVSNAYLNDEWSLGDHWVWNLGSKWEHNSLIDPNWIWRTALLYLPSSKHSFRISAANAYCAPTEASLFYDDKVALPVIPGVLPPPGWPYPDWYYSWIHGNKDLNSSEVVSYEFGYRGLWSDRVMVDVSYLYRDYYQYENLYRSDAGVFVPAIGRNALRRYDYDNGGSGRSQAIAVGVDARLSQQWRIQAQYSHLELELRGVSWEPNITAPRNMGRLGISYTSPQGFMADASGFYTDKVGTINLADPKNEVDEIDDYWRLDLRIAQRIELQNGDLTVGVVGSNLQQEWHEEYSNSFIDTGALPLRRSYYGFVEYRPQ